MALRRLEQEHMIRIYNVYIYKNTTRVNKRSQAQINRYLLKAAPPKKSSCTATCLPSLKPYK